MGKDTKVSFESQTLNCRECGDPVKNVDKKAVSVLCWRCAGGMRVNKIDTDNGPKIRNTPE